MSRIIRFMMITQAVDFSMKITRALEAVGGFEVQNFTSGKNALSHLREHPHDVVLVDFTLRDKTGVELVQAIRRLQPDIGVIAAPYLPLVISQTRTLNMQGVVDIPISARRLIPLIERAAGFNKASETGKQTGANVRRINPTGANTAPDATQTAADTTPSLPPDPNAEQPLEYVLQEAGGGSTQLQASQPMLPADDSQISDESLEIFRRLAAEEPPLPGKAQNPTVSDLIATLRNRRNAAEVIEQFAQAHADLLDAAAEGDTVQDKPVDAERIPAALILTSAMDGTTPIEAFSLSQFMQHIAEQLPAERQNVLPLPSWVQESVRYTLEPDFLQTLTPEYIGQTTIQSGDVSFGITNAQTEVYERPGNTEPNADAFIIERDRLPPPPAMPPRPQASAAQKTEAETKPEPEQATAAQDAADGVHVGYDPHIGQVAVTLTQAALELSAQATVLAQDGKIVAYAGNLPLEDIESLRAQIDDDWLVQPQQARIRFVRLDSTGTDYMLYTRATQTAFTLSMIFSGTLPLGVIRQQAKRLLDALESAPDDAAAGTIALESTPDDAAADISAAPIEPDADDSEAQTPQPAQAADALQAPGPAPQPRIALPAEPLIEVAEAENLAPLTFVWMLGDALDTLSDNMAQNLIMGLDVQLTQSGWRVHDVQVMARSVYVFTDAPGSKSGQAHVRDLQQLATRIVQSVQPNVVAERLWLDSYLVLTPGRALSRDETNEFMAFAQL